MLACARIGAVHSVVFGGFAARELAARIDDARPVLVVTASCGIEVQLVVEYMPLLNAALEIAEHPPDRCIVLQRPQCLAGARPGRDLEWGEALEGAEPATPCRWPRPALRALHLGDHREAQGRRPRQRRPRGRPALVDGEHLRDRAGPRPSGPPRTSAGSSATPTSCTRRSSPAAPSSTRASRWDPGRRRLLARGLAARGEGPLHGADGVPGDQEGGPRRRAAGRYDLSRFRYLFLAGERLDPDTYHWASDLLGIPVIDHWWQTETGWPIAANCMGLEPLPVKPGSPTKAVPGWDVRILDESGAERRRVDGAVVIRLPLPPGALPTLWNDDARFVEGLPVGLRRLLPHRRRRPPRRGRLPLRHGAHGRRAQRGRAPALHRDAGGGLASHPDVAECAVIGVTDELKGQVPVGFVVLKAGVDRDEASCRPSWCETCAPDGAGAPAQARGGGGAACPRPAAARSCAGPCAASPTAGLPGAGHHRRPGHPGGARAVLTPGAAPPP